LAVALGYPHPDHWLAEITGRQLSEWLAFLSVFGPIGERRADLRAGSIVAATRTPPGKPMRAEDFALNFQRPSDREPASLDQMKRQMMKIAGTMGGTLPTK
jgi:hypothetical protein